MASKACPFKQSRYLPWIKILVDFPEGDLLRHMSEDIGVPTYVIIGVWDILCTRAGKGQPRGTLPVPSEKDMDWLVRDSHGDRAVIEQVIQECLKRGWMYEIEDGSRYQIAGWDELQGAPAEQTDAQQRLDKIRADGAARQKKHREKLKAEKEAAAAKATEAKPSSSGTSGSSAPSSKASGGASPKGSAGAGSSGGASSAGDDEESYCGLKGARLAGFKELWKAYDHPRKGEKPPAARAYAALANWTPELAERLVAAARLCTSEDGVAVQGGFIMKLKTWLKDEAFNNDYESMIRSFKEKQGVGRTQGIGSRPSPPGEETRRNIQELRARLFPGSNVASGDKEEAVDVEFTVESDSGHADVAS